MMVFDVVEKLAYIRGIHEHMVYQWVMPLAVGMISWILAEALDLGHTGCSTGIERRRGPCTKKYWMTSEE